MEEIRKNGEQSRKESEKKIKEEEIKKVALAAFVYGLQKGIAYVYLLQKKNILHVYFDVSEKTESVLIYVYRPKKSEVEKIKNFIVEDIHYNLVGMFLPEKLQIMKEWGKILGVPYSNLREEIIYMCAKEVKKIMKNIQKKLKERGID